MQKIYHKDQLIFEVDNNVNTKELVDKHIATMKVQMKPYLDRIKLLENMVADLYPKRSKDSIEEYEAFLRKMNPDFIEALENLGKAVFEDRFTGLYILAPNTVGVLLVYRTAVGFEDKVSIAVLRERLKSQIPSWRHIKIIKE